MKNSPHSIAYSDSITFLYFFIFNFQCNLFTFLSIDESTNKGKSLTPQEWIEAMRMPNTIIVDCRNYYESEVGIVVINSI